MGGGGSSMTIPNVAAGTLDPNQIIQQYAASTDYLKPILDQAATQLQTNIDYANKIGQPFTDTSLAAIDQMRSLAGMKPTTQSQQAASTAFGKTYGDIANNTGDVHTTVIGNPYANAGFTKQDVINVAGSASSPLSQAQYLTSLQSPWYTQLGNTPLNLYQQSQASDAAQRVQWGVNAWNTPGDIAKVTNGLSGLQASSMAPLQDLQKKFDALSSAPNNVEYQKQYAAIQNQFNDYKNSVQYDINNYTAQSKGQSALPKPDGLSYTGVTGLNYKDTRAVGSIYGNDLDSYMKNYLPVLGNQMSDLALAKLSPGISKTTSGSGGRSGTTTVTPVNLNDPAQVAQAAQQMRQTLNGLSYQFSPGASAYANNWQEALAGKPTMTGSVIPNMPGISGLVNQAVNQFNTKGAGFGPTQSFDQANQRAGVPDILSGYNSDLNNLTSQFNNTMSNLPSSMLDPMNADQLQQYVMSLPGFKTQFQTGAQGLQRAQAAKGKLASGQGLLESQNYAQDAIQTAYQNQMNNLAATAGIGLPFQNQQTGSSAAQSEAIRQAAIGAPLLTSDFNTASANARINAQQFNSQNSMQAAIANQSGQLEMAKILAESKGGNPGPVSGYNYQSQGPITNAGSAYFSGLF